MGDAGHVALGRPHPGDDPIGPDTHVGDALPARGAVVEEAPPRPFAADLRGGSALVGAVVPLEKIGVVHAELTEAEELGGLVRPQERTREHECEAESFDDRPHRSDLGGALGQEGQLGPAGVPPLAAPSGLAMSDEDASLIRR